MSNMSYCRFRNTLNDMFDCKKNIGEALESLDEARARVRLIKMCKEISEDKYALDDAEMDVERLEAEAA